MKEIGVLSNVKISPRNIKCFANIFAKFPLSENNHDYSILKRLSMDTFMIYVANGVLAPTILGFFLSFSVAGCALTLQ